MCIFCAYMQRAAIEMRTGSVNCSTPVPVEVKVKPTGQERKCKWANSYENGCANMHVSIAFGAYGTRAPGCIAYSLAH